MISLVLSKPSRQGRQAPPIPFAVVKRQLDVELPGWCKTIKRREP